MGIRSIVIALKVKMTRDPRKVASMHRSRGVVMGEECTVFPGVNFGSEPYLVRLGSRVRITAGVQFVTHDGGMHVLRGIPEFSRADLFGPVVVGSNVFIGIRSIVLPGVRIGDNVVVGAGSVVTRDIPSNSIAAGVPCRVLRTLDDYKNHARQHIDFTKGLTPEEKKRYLLAKEL